jgi:ribosomal protein S17E
MGRVKSALIKRTARALSKEPNKFEVGFDSNKKLLGRLMPSKRLRNRIAGYITRMKKNDIKKKARFKNEVTSEQNDRRDN